MALQGGAEEEDPHARGFTIPSELSVEEIGDLLESGEYGLEECRELLEVHSVDGEQFVSLTEATIVAMGIKRRLIPRLLEAVAEMAAECPETDPKKKKQKKKKGARRDFITQTPECMLPTAANWTELLEARGDDGCATVVKDGGPTLFGRLHRIVQMLRVLISGGWQRYHLNASPSLWRCSKVQRRL
jgi:hypothetical protein